MFMAQLLRIRLPTKINTAKKRMISAVVAPSESTCLCGRSSTLHRVRRIPGVPVAAESHSVVNHRRARGEVGGGRPGQTGSGVKGWGSFFIYSRRTCTLYYRAMARGDCGDTSTTTNTTHEPLSGVIPFSTSTLFLCWQFCV